MRYDKAEVDEFARGLPFATDNKGSVDICFVGTDFGKTTLQTLSVR
jgi:hypothetical protein